MQSAIEPAYGTPRMGDPGDDGSPRRGRIISIFAQGTRARVKLLDRPVEGARFNFRVDALVPASAVDRLGDLLGDNSG